MFCSSCGANVTQTSGFCPACGAAMLPAPRPAYPAPLNTIYATWATRVMGAIVDFLLVGVGMLVLYLALGGVVAGLATVGDHGLGSGVCCLTIMLMPLATLLVGLYNSVYLISHRGFSIGQGIVKVKVVDANGQLLSAGTAMIRLLVRAGLSIIPFLSLLDLLWPLWDERRQTLHDKAINCYVIDNPSGV